MENNENLIKNPFRNAYVNPLLFKVNPFRVNPTIGIDFASLYPDSFRYSLGKDGKLIDLHELSIQNH